MQKLADEVFVAVKDWLQRNLQPLDARVRTLEERPQPKDGQPGERGAVGERGEKGSAGERGETGLQGEPGARGDAGEKGEAGPRGEKGEPGERGPQGERGDAGPGGAAGEKGERGDAGELGPAGEKGADGQSAFDIAVQKGFTGTAQEWLASLKGADGKPGATGERGDRGEKGEPGIVGTKGDPGQDGRDGQEGPAGRDAAQIDVLSWIDETRRYQRGAYASHKGGLWRAFRQTDLLGDDATKAGWECIVRGLDREEETASEDGRTITRSTHYSDGTVFRRVHKFAGVIYRGIWKEGERYERGDSTTRDGSTWVLMGDEQKGKPGEDGSGWLLSVKRGRDGKDATPGQPQKSEPVRLK